jgi:hypothetical protein
LPIPPTDLEKNIPFNSDPYFQPRTPGVMGILDREGKLVIINFIKKMSE